MHLVNRCLLTAAGRFGPLRTPGSLRWESLHPNKWEWERNASGVQGAPFLYTPTNSTITTSISRSTPTSTTATTGTACTRTTTTSTRSTRNCLSYSSMLHERNMAQSLGGTQEQSYDYFLVLDFEATCDDTTRPKPQEIIEFPVLKVSGKTFKTEAVFHQYVQPRIHLELTDFCTKLTGIVQDMVDGQPYLEDTLQSFDKWMADEGLLQEDVQSIFVTCGDWDLNRMLPSQTAYFNLQCPGYLKSWINIKKPFADVVGSYGKGMMSMLRQLNLEHEGRHHSGIDDCKNIANILRALAERGYVFKATGHLQ